MVWQGERGPSFRRVVAFRERDITRKEAAERRRRINKEAKQFRRGGYDPGSLERSILGRL
jgi:hypothetical protein